MTEEDLATCAIVLGDKLIAFGPRGANHVQKLCPLKLSTLATINSGISNQVVMLAVGAGVAEQKFRETKELASALP